MNVVLGPPPETLTPAHIDRMCSATGPMQYQWGETGIPGSSRSEDLLGIGMGVPESFAPFESAQPRSSEFSDQLAMMNYKIKIGRGDDVTEGYHAFADGLVPIIEAAGWTQHDLTMDNAPIYLAAFTGDYAFEKFVETEEGDNRLLMSIDSGLGEAFLSCGRDDLALVLVNEVFGRLSPGTPRPVPVEVDIPDRYTAQQCGDPTFAASIWDKASDKPMTRYMAATLRRASYRDKLTTWMLWKIDESGKIEPMELVGLAMDAAGGASPGGNPLAALSRITDMFPLITELGDAHKAQDKAGFCLAMARFQDFIAETDEITTAQSAAIHAQLEAEAARLGVDLSQ